MLNWVSRFNIFCFLDNQDYSFVPQHYECIAGAGIQRRVTTFSEPLEKGCWHFGHLSYEARNELHGSPSSKEDPIGFPTYFFFVPQVVLFIKDGQLVIEADAPEVTYGQIMETDIPRENPIDPIPIQQRLSKETYIQTIDALRKHIQRGDCYEINFCQEFFGEEVDIDPPKVFNKLTRLSPNPFSALYRVNDSYLICASPERFLTRSGNRILSQPMKGTIKRDLNDSGADAALKQELQTSAKDQSENVMVVDLVRNDMSRVCKEGTVKVDELFGIYSFPQVHQMVSTISGELNEDVSFQEIIKALFPMGSMTGAPKHRVMQLIDEYEPSARGIFSGAVGYITHEGDFDFNVVIRSIMYNSSTRYLSYQVGSGITFYSEPEKEWEECLLKGEAIKKVLAGGPAL